MLLNRPDVDINKHDNQGWTPLKSACSYSGTDSNIDTVKLLLNRSDIDINKHDYEGWTPLMAACRYSNTYSDIGTVKLLLDRPDTDVNKQQKDGWSALMLAAAYSCDGSDIETIKLLLSHPKININNCENNGYTALMLACLYSSSDGNSNESDDDNSNNSNSYSDIETVKLLLSYSNIDVNKKNCDGKNALEILYEYDDLAEAFIESILNNNIYVDKDMLKLILEKNISYFDPLYQMVFNPLNFDYKVIAKILKKHNNGKKIIQYCNLHTIVKPNILINIPNHKEEIYGKPNNILALCSEINFKLKFKNPEQVFEELDDKLKFIFDIKNESDMVNKISFYL